MIKWDCNKIELSKIARTKTNTTWIKPRKNYGIFLSCSETIDLSEASSFMFEIFTDTYTRYHTKQIGRISSVAIQITGSLEGRRNGYFAGSTVWKYVFVLFNSIQYLNSEYARNYRLKGIHPAEPSHQNLM